MRNDIDRRSNSICDRTDQPGSAAQRVSTPATHSAAAAWILARRHRNVLHGRLPAIVTHTGSPLIE